MAVVSDSTTRPPFGIAGQGGHLVVLDASSSVLLEVQHDRGAESRDALVGAIIMFWRVGLATDSLMVQWIIILGKVYIVGCGWF